MGFRLSTTDWEGMLDIVGFGLFIIFVDSETNIKEHQPCPLKTRKCKCTKFTLGCIYIDHLCCECASLASHELILKL